ncbi:MAG TPA: DUF2752 domain-containing protein [Ferruginibacter sp.]|nr:DUF2752 domain-containing protein [Ferruginibacter sp.]
MKKYFHNYFEVTAWISALIFLALFDPSTPGIRFCFFKLIGFQSCPGCGLGHSISWVFHGNIQRSFDAHPLGLMALVIISTRISILFKSLFHSFKPKL